MKQKNVKNPKSVMIMAPNAMLRRICNAYEKLSDHCKDLNKICEDCCYLDYMKSKKEKLYFQL